MSIVNIARCPLHGLHGAREECFTCGDPVEQIPMIAADAVQAVIDKCRDLRQQSVDNARRELKENGWQAELGYHHVQFEVCEEVLALLGESDDLVWIRDAMGFGEGAA